MTAAVCFDLDGTLVQFDRPYEDVLRGALGEHLPVDDALVETYDRAFSDAFDALEPEPYRRGMEAVVAARDGDAEPAAMVEALRTAEYAATTVPDAARTALEGLGETDRLGVVTNGVADWQRGKLAHHDLAGLFDAVVASYEAGAHKPDAAPFDLLRERLPAEEYVMVGDDYEADVEGGRRAGFVPVHYETSGPDLWATLDALL